MTADRVTDFPIRFFEYLFDPVGLPLVQKTPDAPPTTTMLIRGPAGVGKTTYALGLAHAIAKHNQGAVLYILGESSPTELDRKLEILGLADQSVVPAGAPFSTGDVVFAHALLEAETAPVSLLDVIKVAWSQLKRADDGSCPIRACVLDPVMIWPEEAADAALRGEVAAFLQAAEVAGVSSVLVEEVYAGGPDWLPFAADNVLEMAWTRFPEGVGPLDRTLAYTKCRYGLATPGPHGLGLFDLKCAIWPSLDGVLRRQNPLAAADKGFGGLWAPHGTELVRLCPGDLLLSQVGGPPVLRILAETPGFAAVRVDAGAWITASSGLGKAASEDLRNAASEGLASLFWGLRHACKGNVIVLQGVGYLLRHPRCGSEVADLLGAWQAAGYLVVVHEVWEEIAALRSQSTHYFAESSKWSRAWLASSFVSVRWAVERQTAAADDVQLAVAVQTEFAATNALDRATWAALVAAHSDNDTALDTLSGYAGSDVEPKIVWLWLQALARRQRFDDLRKRADAFAKAHGKPAWFADRLVGEAMVSAGLKTEALAVIDKLLAGTDLPPAQRADVEFNRSLCG